MPVNGEAIESRKRPSPPNAGRYVRSLSDGPEFAGQPLMAPAFSGGGGLAFAGANAALWTLHLAFGASSDARTGIIVPEMTRVIESNRYWLPLFLRLDRGTFGGTTPPKPLAPDAVDPCAMLRSVQ
jgi:hypothetical protein